MRHWTIGVTPRKQNKENFSISSLPLLTKRIFFFWGNILWDLIISNKNLLASLISICKSISKTSLSLIFASSLNLTPQIPNNFLQNQTIPKISQQPTSQLNSKKQFQPQHNNQLKLIYFEELEFP